MSRFIYIYMNLDMVAPLAGIFIIEMVNPLMNYPLYIDTVSKDVSNLYSKVLRQSRFLINDVFLSLKVAFI